MSNNSDEGFVTDHESGQSGPNSVTGFGEFASEGLKDNEFDAINVIVR